MIRKIFSEENMQRRLGPIVDRIAKIERQIPSWTLKLIGFPCWFSAAFTGLIAFQGMTTSQRIIYGMIPAIVGTICGMILMIRMGPSNSSD